MKKAVMWWSVVLVVFSFAMSTFVSARPSNGSAAQVVNAGCAAHGGVRTWGGEESYDATCEDGTAFVGSRHHWASPWWAWWN